ncbi:MAG: integrase, partial [Oscillospiraceae bacterium]|nr:integrase [Oscillospiraceae bacterium]
IEGRIGCHGLRKTLGYHASKAKTPQAVLMEIYRHSSWAVTKRYLDITQDEIDAVYLKVPLF